MKTLKYFSIILSLLILNSCNKEESPLSPASPDYLIGKWKQTNVINNNEIYYYFGFDGKFILDQTLPAANSRYIYIGTYVYSDSLITVTLQTAEDEFPLGSGQWSAGTTNSVDYYNLKIFNNRELEFRKNSSTYSFVRVFE